MILLVAFATFAVFSHGWAQAAAVLAVVLWLAGDGVRAAAYQRRQAGSSSRTCPRPDSRPTRQGNAVFGACVGLVVVAPFWLAVFLAVR